MARPQGHRNKISRRAIFPLLLVVFCGLIWTQSYGQLQRLTDLNLLGRLTARNANNLRVSFSYSPRYPAEGQPVQFADASTGNPVSWRWDFGDGTTSLEKNPVHVFTSSGFRKVSLVATNGTTSKKVTRTLTVMPSVSPATFVFSPLTPGPGQTVQFADTTSGDPTSWRWTFGDGATSTLKNPTHVFLREGSYQVTLVASTISGSRTGTQTIAVALMSTLLSSFNYSPSAPVAGQTVQFTDTSTGGPTSWQWNFGDGTTSSVQNPSHAFPTAGSRTVTLIVSNATGSNTTSRALTVGTALAASFTFSPASPTAGQAVQFTDTSAGSPTSWQWNFGDGTTSNVQNPSHAFSTAGARTVTLIVSNATGSNTTSRALTVGTALAASFTFSPTSPTAGQAVQFTDTSAGSPTSWQWEFGDGSVSALQSPSHTFSTPGSYTVNLTVGNGSGTSHTTRAVTVQSVPMVVASFVFSPSTPSPGQVIQFSDRSTGSPTSWQWNFGDGATSVSQNPSHAFRDIGSYQVSLVASSGTSSNSTIVTVTVVGDAPPTGDYDWLLVDKAERLADWSLAGVWHDGVKGIPGLPAGVTLQATDPSAAYYIDPTGATDCASRIQAAVAAAPEGTAVVLPAGTFRTTVPITANGRSVALRGRGPGVTTIRFVGANGAAVSFTGRGLNAGTAIQSGYQAGSSSLTLASVSGLAVGRYAMVSETNDDEFLGGATTYMHNAVGQIVRIASIVGTTVTIDRPLYYAHSAANGPILQAMDTLDAVGVEELSIDCSYSDMVTGIRFLDVTNGWVRKVEVFGSLGWQVALNRSARCELTRNFIHHGRQFGSAYGICLYGRSTDNLVEDNIVYYQRHHISFEYSGCGNVIGYNYCNAGWDENYPAVPSVMQSIHNHGGFQCKNLIEGNSADQINHDSYLSQCASDGMFLFRNHSRAFSINATQGRRFAFENAVRGYHTTLVGNVLGMVGDYGDGTYEATPGDPYTRSVYRVGWHGSASSGTMHGVALPDAACAATMVREGNYDYFSDQTRWDGGQTQAIPPSLYLKAKPAWFGAYAWPPIGSDVTGYVTLIPAKARWDAYSASSSLADIFADPQGTARNQQNLRR